MNLSDWDCTLESDTHSAASVPTADKRTWGIGGPAVRLGFGLIKGLQAAHARQIVERRRQHGPFRSIDDFHAVTELPVSAVAKLSEADAFASLPKSRRVALWETLALSEERSPLAMPPGESAGSAEPLAFCEEVLTAPQLLVCSLAIFNVNVRPIPFDDCAGLVA